MRKVIIKSNLIGKEECFRMLALASATQMPLLINGEKGTGKTAAVLDFASSYTSNQNLKHFIIEMSESTKASNLLGMPDIEKLTVDKKWSMLRPITKANVIVINEVDKASTSVRNSMLSIMAEKKIFDGDNVVDCIWDTFVATSNDIPKGEETSPFYDRLPLRYNMPKISNSEIITFMNDRSYKEVVTIDIPDSSEIQDTKINYDHVKLMLDLIEDNGSISISNRTLTKLDTLIKAAHHVWGKGSNYAILKIAELIAKPIMTELSEKLLPKLVSSFYSQVEAFDAASRDNKDSGNKVGMSHALSNLHSILRQIESNEKLKDLYHKELNLIFCRVADERDKKTPSLESFA